MLSLRSHVAAMIYLILRSTLVADVPYSSATAGYIVFVIDRSPSGSPTAFSIASRRYLYPTILIGIPIDLKSSDISRSRFFASSSRPAASFSCPAPVLICLILLISASPSNGFIIK